jgi:hypothetical protein
MKGKNIVLNMDAIKWNPKGAGLQRVWDSVQAGLNVRVYPTGKKVFYIRFNEHGKQRLRKLGDFPALSLENARSDAAEIRKKAKEGITAAATVRITMGELWEEITRNTVYPFHSNASSTQKNYLIYWNSYITFKDLPVTEIKAKHWRSLNLDYRDKGKLLPIQLLDGIPVKAQLICFADDFLYSTQADSQAVFDLPHVELSMQA